ncbi:hypothetical protein BB558_000045 [Smittium angustum]|nr:hypothetical protein BB558_000045 [Smittium angustum]
MMFFKKSFEKRENKKIPKKSISQHNFVKSADFQEKEYPNDNLFQGLDYWGTGETLKQVQKESDKKANFYFDNQTSINTNHNKHKSFSTILKKCKSYLQLNKTKYSFEHPTRVTNPSTFEKIDLDLGTPFKHDFF